MHVRKAFCNLLTTAFGCRREIITVVAVAVVVVTTIKITAVSTTTVVLVVKLRLVLNSPLKDKLMLRQVLSGSHILRRVGLEHIRTEVRDESLFAKLLNHSATKGCDRCDRLWKRHPNNL